MHFCKDLRVQRRTVWTRTRTEPDLKAELDQDELLSLRYKVPARAIIPGRSIVQVRSIVLVLVLLGCLVSVKGILNEDQEELLVELHNHYRGQVKPSASAMLPLKWDGNLKILAEEYAVKCVWNHNPELTDTGENLFVGTGELDLQRALEKWFLEKEHYNYYNNSCTEDQMCGHYTQMVWADTHRVGCAVHVCAQMEGLGWTGPTNFLVCNYFPAGNFEGERPYVEGEKCSQCPEILQTCENNLCEHEENKGIHANEESKIESPTPTAGHPWQHLRHPTSYKESPEPTEAEPIEEDPTDVGPPSTDGEDQDSVTRQTLYLTSPDLDVDQASVLKTEQSPDQDPEGNTDQPPDQDTEYSKTIIEQEAVVPPPATESIPPEPLGTTATPDEIGVKPVPEAKTETGSESEPVTGAEPEGRAEPEPDTSKEYAAEDRAVTPGVLTEQEQKVSGRGPPTQPLGTPPGPKTLPPENRGQKQKGPVEKRSHNIPVSHSVVLSGSWSLVFLWILL